MLQGYITSGGAGSESVLQASRAAFVAYVNDCSSFHLGMYCTTLVDIVLNNRSNDRLVLPAMDFLGFLFDAGILPRLTIADFGHVDTTVGSEISYTDVNTDGVDSSIQFKQPISRPRMFARSKLLSRSMLAWLSCQRSKQ